MHLGDTLLQKIVAFLRENSNEPNKRKRKCLRPRKKTLISQKKIKMTLKSKKKARQKKDIACMEFRCKMFLYLFLFFVERFLVMFGYTWQLFGMKKSDWVQFS